MPPSPRGVDLGPPVTSSMTGGPGGAFWRFGGGGSGGLVDQVGDRVAGSDSFKVPLSVTITKGRSSIEPGLVPAKNTTLTFKSFTDAANSAGMSRRYGGIHFEAGDLNGRTLGSRIGSQVWAKARDLLQRHRQLTGQSPTLP